MRKASMWRVWGMALVVMLAAAGCVSVGVGRTGTKGEITTASRGLPGAPAPDWLPGVLNVAFSVRGPGEYWIEGRLRTDCHPLCRIMVGPFNRDLQTFVERYRRAGVAIKAGPYKRTGNPRFIEATFQWKVPPDLIKRKDGVLHVELFQVCPFDICAVKVPGEVVESSTRGYVPAGDPSVVIFRKKTPMGFDFKPKGTHPDGIVNWKLIEEL
ncbi:hypothetical protein [Thermosulfurimonas sp. F29]|uniref:hypothetical protein n=1 Tax=Thermosulfurimonas sp. F29 TaxID=2867247 RepID=UPI001C83F5FB|nr:hypothetical protein [Thermosulfurimonas sp. F29]MBX6424201.1 hypothetical protein [Thermosulfurimonas sp. F29]